MRSLITRRSSDGRGWGRGGGGGAQTGNLETVTRGILGDGLVVGSDRSNSV